MIQNEILIEYDHEEPSPFTIGRSVKRDVEIQLKAVSSEHCSIYYNPNTGWFLSEK